MKVRTVSYKSQNNSHEFTQSLHQTGFSVLTDHPIDIDLINSVYDEWKKFFNNEKKHHYIYDTVKQDGFFPLGTENAKGASVSDLKEFYHFYKWGKVPNGLSDNPMDTNWGGAVFTNKQVMSGKYKGNDKKMVETRYQ